MVGMINEFGAVGGMRISKGNYGTEENMCQCLLLNYLC
jgi:hypothetical protein